MKFTQKEDDYIIANVGKKPYSEIGKDLGRSLAAIARRAFLLGTAKQKPSTPLSRANKSEIKSMYASGFTPSDIRKIINKPLDLIKQYIDDECKVKKRTRKCLSCQDNFQSDGSHNRICGTCKDSGPYKRGHNVLGVEGLYT